MIPRFRAIVICPYIVALTACSSATPVPNAPSSVISAEASNLIRQVEQGLVPLNVPQDSMLPTMLIEERMRHYRVPGVSIAIIHNGRVEWARGYGVTEAGGSQPVDTATLFQAASISKPIAAIAALRLVEQGHLVLDEDVNPRLASWQVPENEYSHEEKVTLRRILSHTAGLTVKGFRGYAPGEPVPTLRQVLTGAPTANSPAVRVGAMPGSVQRYSGGGYTVAQLLMSDVSGRSFADLMNDLVLRPTQMVHSTFAMPLPGALASLAATGHGPNGAPMAGQWHVYPEQAAAGLWSTPCDLARLAIEVQRSAAGREGGVLSPAMTRQMLTRHGGPYGLGFNLVGEGDGRIFRHSGANMGFRAQLVAYTATGQGAVVMTNSDSGAELADEIMRSIAVTYGWPGAK